MNYTEQEINKLVKVTQPEVIYAAQEKVKGVKLLKRCRNKATNYQDTISQIEAAQGGVIEDTQKALCKEAADAAILSFLNKEHLEVIELAQDQKKSLAKIFQTAKVASVKKICDLLDSASDNLKEMAQLENSRDTLLRYNNVYRGQKKMTLELLKIEKVDPALIKKVEKLYKPQSVNTLIPVWQNLTDWESSETLKLLKKANAFAQLKVFKNADS